MNRLLLLVPMLFVAMTFGSACANGTANENTEMNDKQTKNIIPVSDEANSKVIHLTNDTFKKLVFNYEVNKEWKYEGSKPCIIDFYADWCMPCKRVAPILDELAKEYSGELIIYKIDTEKQRELASTFGIRSIPSILFVPKDGQPQMAQGALPKESLVQAIEDVLKVKK